MLEHMDNFSMYGNNTGLLLNGVYSTLGLGISLQPDPDGISTGYVLRHQDNNGGGAQYVLSAAQTKVGVGARLWCAALNYGFPLYPGIGFIDGGGNLKVAVQFDNTGRAMIKTANNTIIAISDVPVISAQGWYHVEALLSVGAGATDDIEVRIEGIPVITLTDQNFGLDSIYQTLVGAFTFFSNTDVGRTTYWKDLVIYNGQGIHNNDFLGTVVIYDLPPTADVDLNWTPSVGTEGWPILDNSPPNDAQYLTAPNPPPSPYVFSHGALPPDVTSVKALMTMVRAAKNDGGDASLQVGVISDPDGVPATVLGSNRPITIAQTFWRDVFEEDPKTAAPWLPSAVAVSEVQLNRTA